MRVVSLLSSSTEIIAALGYESYLVGRSHECDQPESIRALPFCTSPKFPTDGTSYEIDQRVKAIVQEGLSVYRVDAKALEALKPDLLVTQTQCEVCAVSLKDVEGALRECIKMAPQVLSVEPNDLDGIWTSVRQIAKALGDAKAGEKLIERLRTRMSAIDEQTRGSRQVRVAMIEWINPLMSAGHWMPEIIEMAGGQNLFGEAGKHSPWMTWEQLKYADPEVIIVAPCGLDIGRTKTEMATLTILPDWQELQASKTKKVFISDGNQFFNRPGPRIVETLEIVAECLHPELFNFGHRVVLSRRNAIRSFVKRDLGEEEQKVILPLVEAQGLTADLIRKHTVSIFDIGFDGHLFRPILGQLLRASRLPPEKFFDKVDERFLLTIRSRIISADDSTLDPLDAFLKIHRQKTAIAEERFAEFLDDYDADSAEAIYDYFRSEGKYNPREFDWEEALSLLFSKKIITREQFIHEFQQPETLLLTDQERFKLWIKSFVEGMGMPEAALEAGESLEEHRLIRGDLGRRTGRIEKVTPVRKDVRIEWEAEHEKESAIRPLAERARQHELCRRITRSTRKAEKAQ